MVESALPASAVHSESLGAERPRTRLKQVLRGTSGDKHRRRQRRASRESAHCSAFAQFPVAETENKGYILRATRSRAFANSTSILSLSQVDEPGAGDAFDDEVKQKLAAR
jgi:hypothetical protein